VIEQLDDNRLIRPRAEYIGRLSVALYSYGRAVGSQNARLDAFMRLMAGAHSTAGTAPGAERASVADAAVKHPLFELFDRQ